MIIGNQITRQFQTNQWGTLKWGLYNIPDTTTQKYPIIVFFHGLGETGTTESNLSKLLVHGTPYLLSQGVKLEFTNPFTNQTNKFISLALQDQYWSPSITEVMYILENDSILKDRIDWNGVFITGLSAGGQQTMNSILTSAEITNKITATIPMSSAGYDSSKISLGVAKPVWAFHGLQDTTCGYGITEGFINQVGGKWTKLPPTHSNWNSVYSTSYKEVVNGFSVNIYQWALMQMKQSVLTIDTFDLTRINNTIVLSSPNGLGNDVDEINSYTLEKTSDGINFSTEYSIPATGKQSYIFSI